MNVALGRAVSVTQDVTKTTFGLRPDIAEKQATIAHTPNRFFQTPHHVGRPAILVRLENVDMAELEDLITDSWLLNAQKRLAETYRSRALKLK